MPAVSGRLGRATWLGACAPAVASAKPSDPCLARRAGPDYEHYTATHDMYMMRCI